MIHKTCVVLSATPLTIIMIPTPEEASTPTVDASHNINLGALRETRTLSARYNFKFSETGFPSSTHYLGSDGKAFFHTCDADQMLHMGALPVARAMLYGAHKAAGCIAIVRYDAYGKLQTVELNEVVFQDDIAFGAGLYHNTLHMFEGREAYIHEQYEARDPKRLSAYVRCHAFRDFELPLDDVWVPLYNDTNLIIPRGACHYPLWLHLGVLLEIQRTNNTLFGWILHVLRPDGSYRGDESASRGWYKPDCASLEIAMEGALLHYRKITGRLTSDSPNDRAEMREPHALPPPFSLKGPVVVNPRPLDPREEHRTQAPLLGDVGW